MSGFFATITCNFQEQLSARVFVASYSGKTEAKPQLAFLLLHGGASSAMTFALLAKKLSACATCVAPDLLCHGDSGGADKVAPGSLRFEDAVAHAQGVAEWALEHTQVKKLVLVGHSMGACVAAKLAHTLHAGTVGALVMIEMIEELALESYDKFAKMLAKRPSEFRDTKEAITWSVSANWLQSLKSAKLSIPALLHHDTCGRLTWKTDLAASKANWPCWFEGVDANFMTTTASKLLVLAKTATKLDKDLSIGQMQGKFQLKVVPE